MIAVQEDSHCLQNLVSQTQQWHFSLWRFWRNCSSSPNCQCVSSLWHGLSKQTALAWSVKADCPEVESYNVLWKTLYQNLFFHFWPCLTKAFLNCGLSSQSSWSTFWWPLVTSCLLISCKENRLMKDRRQTHGFSPPRIKSRDLKILSGYHEGRNSDFHDNGASGFLVGYHLQWWNFL